MQAGASPAWFLIDASGVMKPLIFQNRQAVKFVAKDNPEDERVFMNDEFTYGADSRNAAGYGFWQKAFGSKAALTPANFALAYDAMTAFKGDQGAKLGIKATHLICGTSTRAAAETNLKKMNLAGGESNLDYGRVELVVTPWLD
jgi:phage major head subunit gpT-like protein